MRITLIIILFLISIFGLPEFKKEEKNINKEIDQEVVIKLEREKYYKTNVLPIVNKFNTSDAYGNIIARCKQPSLDNGHRMTNAHETTHFIHSELRNYDVLSRKVSGLPAAFYIFPDKSFHSKQPKFARKEIEKYIPKSLRYSRFTTYFVNNRDWSDYPLYIIDEFVSYINGSIVALDDYNNKIPIQSTDPMVGPLEFAVYSVATCMAIRDKDPEYWNDLEFQDFMYDIIKKSESVFKAGRNIYPNNTQEEILRNLKTSPDAEPIRAFMKEYFDGFFLSID